MTSFQQEEDESNDINHALDIINVIIDDFIDADELDNFLFDEYIFQENTNFNQCIGEIDFKDIDNALKEDLWLIVLDIFLKLLSI